MNVKKETTAAQDLRKKAGQISARIVRAKMDIRAWEEELALLQRVQPVLFVSTDVDGDTNATR